MSDKLYGHDDARDYEPYFSRHLMAMTTEDLHSKGEIACELAYRDARIAELESRIHEAQEVYAGMEGFIPVHASEAYLQRIIDQMYKALLGGGE